MFDRALILAVMLTAGCGKKAPPAAPAPVPEPAPAPMPEPEPEPEPTGATAERPDAEKPSNADFTAVLGFADGTNKKGHVVRVERSEDWYAEKGWTDADMKRTVTLEGSGTEVEKNWADLRSVAITYGSKSDIQCQFDSAYTPVMYMCVLKTTTKVTDGDGKSWDAAGRHKWKFVFESGDTEEFWIYKLPARQQEEGVPDLGTTDENTDLYIALQKKLMSDRAGHVVTSIKITPPS